MNHKGENEGIRVLDDFVCDAAGVVDRLNPDDGRAGRNEGVRIVEETVCDATPTEGTAAEMAFPDLDSAMQSVELDETVELIVKRLAACVNAHDNPFRTLALIQQRLIAEIETGLPSKETSHESRSED